MARNGSGTFVRAHDFTDDAAAAIKIRADRMDEEIDGIATALSASIANDGQTTILADLPMSTHKFTGLGNGSAATDSAAYGQVTSAISTLTAGLVGFLNGLTLSTAGASATFGIAVGVGADTTGAALMALASAYTKTTSAWAVGTGNGALDTGAIATGTWYHVWLIKRVDIGTVDILISLSATAPTMPANYTLKRRIGAMKTNGSSQWLKFTQFGDRFIWAVTVAELANANIASATTQTLLGLPTGVNVVGRFRGGINDSATENNLRVASPSETTWQAGDWVCSVIAGGTPNDIASFFTEAMTNTSAQVLVHLSTYNATNGVWLITIGWIDTRGRDG